MRITRFCLLILALLPTLVQGDPPPRPLPKFDAAKHVARDAIYAGHHIDFYCGCTFTPNKTKSGGSINAKECGYAARKNKARGKVLEWEHVMPAWFFGHTRVCWAKGNKKCVTSEGTAYKGRTCCGRVDKTFQRIEADLHNLTPAVGELNGDRSNLPYGMVDGEQRLYGACDFEIGGKPRVTEPPDNVKGDAARIWFYMADTYKVKLTAAQRKMFEEWAVADPVDDWERLRNERVFAAQGNRNPHIK